MSNAEPIFPIRVVAEMTGVAPATLRAWERRYGRPRPQRTESGHRLYSQQDVAAIRELRSRADAGEPLAHAATRPPAAPAVAALDDAWASHRRRLLRAIERFDPQELERTYSDLLALFPIELVSDRLLRPTIELLGERWTQRDAGIAEEHFFSAFLRNKLGARLHHALPQARGPQLVTACLPGERHEFGLLLFGLAASGLGYRLLHLGPDLPVAQAALVAERTRADGLLLSGTTTVLDDGLRRELAALPARLGIPVAVGGLLAEREAAALEAAGLVTLGSGLQAALDRCVAVVPPTGGRT